MNPPACRLSVVLGTCDRLPQVRRCLESIFRTTRQPVVVYVSDAGSGDGTVEYLKTAASAAVIPVFHPGKLGQARAYNELFAMVTTPYVCWLSDDNEVLPGALDTATAILDEHPSIGLVALKTRDCQGPFRHAPYIGGISSIGVLNVNQGVMRTDILQRLGGFCEEYRDYGIDPDLTARVLFAGHRIVYTRRIALLHYRNWHEDPHSLEFMEMQAKQRRYLELYERKFSALGTGLAYPLGFRGKRRLRGLIGMLAQHLFRGRALGRNLYNVFNGRYIRTLDGLLTMGRPFHLVQYPPQRRRPAAGEG